DLYRRDPSHLSVRPPSEVAAEQEILARHKLDSFLKSEFPRQRVPENLVMGRRSDANRPACPEQRTRSHHYAYARRYLPQDVAWFHDRKSTERHRLSGIDHSARGDNCTETAQTTGMGLRHWLERRFGKGPSVCWPSCEGCPCE